MCEITHLLLLFSFFYLCLFFLSLQRERERGSKDGEDKIKRALPQEVDCKVSSFIASPGWLPLWSVTIRSLFLYPSYFGNFFSLPSLLSSRVLCPWPLNAFSLILPPCAGKNGDQTDQTGARGKIIHKLIRACSRALSFLFCFVFIFLPYRLS